MSVTTVEHPGPLLPGAPRFRLTLPDGWDVAPAPRALAVARPSVALPGFVPNLTVTADLVPVGTSAAEVLTAVLADYPGQVPAVSPGAGGDGHGGTASVRLTRPHGEGSVQQRVDVLVDPTPVPGGHRHALTVVSSWSDATPDDLRDALAAAHTSVRLGTADPVPA